ncbi:MAG: hypothetical protein VYB44_07155 [Bacteroidota bacterium]|nr:hypothetical protein [Bacteroidota bacterium]
MKVFDSYVVMVHYVNHEIENDVDFVSPFYFLEESAIQHLEHLIKIKLSVRNFTKVSETEYVTDDYKVSVVPTNSNNELIRYEFNADDVEDWIDDSLLPGDQ